MSLIHKTRYYPAKSSQRTKHVLLMCGFGGAIWQTRRLTNVLNRAGYNVTALDFPKLVLSQGDKTLLPAMVDEVVSFAESQAKEIKEPVLLVGISLGSLLSLNILRRSQKFNEAIMITGGNIVTVAQNIYGRSVWPQTHTELSKYWHNVNIFTEPSMLRGKHALFVIPMLDKLINTEEVLTEINKQNEAGNRISLIKRTSFGHIGTIIEETILFPKRVLSYIEQLSS